MRIIRRTVQLCPEGSGDSLGSSSTCTGRTEEDQSQEGREHSGSSDCGTCRARTAAAFAPNAKVLHIDIDRAEIMEPDQQFEVTAMRAQKLVSLGYVELVEPEIMPAPGPVAPAAPAVTREACAKAAANLMRTNPAAREQLKGILTGYGVNSIPTIPEVMLPDFAEKIRALGGTV